MNICTLTLVPEEALLQQATVNRNAHATHKELSFATTQLAAAVLVMSSFFAKDTIGQTLGAAAYLVKGSQLLVSLFLHFPRKSTPLM